MLKTVANERENHKNENLILGMQSKIEKKGRRMWGISAQPKIDIQGFKGYRQTADHMWESASKHNDIN